MMEYRNLENKKTRGMLARSYILAVFQNQRDPMYTASDLTLARKLNITRLTVINIRKELNLKNRKQRIVGLLTNVDTSTLTIKELATRFFLKYQNVYKIVKELGLKTQPDKKPVESMIEYQMKRKKQVCNNGY